MLNTLLGRVIPALILICFEAVSHSQPVNYRKVFGSNWEKAEAFVADNEAWMKQASRKFSVSYPEAIAVIFPELIRYSAIRDKIEITLLKALYINLGEEYADFSIGQFQMKPSFAELVHRKSLLLKGSLRKQFRDNASVSDSVIFRKAIVKDLETPVSQFLYLAAFLKICETVYDLKLLDEVNRIKFLATAYNYSFQKSFDEINGMTGKRFFYTGLIKTENYSYAEISIFWFNQYSEKSK